MPLNRLVKTKGKSHQFAVESIPRGAKGDSCLPGVCCSCALCLSSCLGDVMLQRHCCILPGASRGLGTGDLFLLICPAQWQASAPSAQRESGPISFHDLINNHQRLLSPHISLRREQLLRVLASTQSVRWPRVQVKDADNPHWCHRN